MTIVTDEQDVKTVFGKASGFVVNFGHQRARCINGAQVSSCCFFVNNRRHPVGRKNDQGTFGNLVGFVNKNRSTLFKRVHHMLVVNDLFADIDRSPIKFEGFLNCLHCTVHSGAISTRGSEQDLTRRTHAPIVGAKGPIRPTASPSPRTIGGCPHPTPSRRRWLLAR